jgi:hypothetical protein
VILVDVGVFTADVVIGNVYVVVLAGTVIEDDTTLTGVLDNVTVVAVGIEAFKVTVPVTPVVPPTTDAGTVTDANSGSTVNGCVKERPLQVACIVQGLLAVTDVVLTLKVAVVCPAVNVTDAGTVAAVPLETDRYTVTEALAGTA